MSAEAPASSSSSKRPSSEITSPAKPETPKFDFEPPVASIRRILKSSLPPHITLSKDALAAFNRSSGIFILYVTTCANDFAREGKRSTIGGGDIMASLRELGFGGVAGEVEEFMAKWREREGTKKEIASKEREVKRQKKESVAEPVPATVPATATATATTITTTEAEEVAPTPTPNTE